MTGFAMVRKPIAQGEVVFSLKSVNHRGLDLQFRLPPELDALELDLRAALKSRLARGHVQVSVSITRTGAAGAAALNRPLLEAYVRAFREAAALHGLEGQPDLNSALRVPGMLSSADAEELHEEVAQATLAAAAEAAAALNQVREREGAATAAELQDRCRAITLLVKRMEEIRAGATAAFQKRLNERLADLLNGAAIEPQRLAQEAAVLADRSDISEELVRLRLHAGQLDQILQTGGEVGKRLDFLLQEMNRESNTILSKTGGLGELGLTMTDLALSAKAEIDKIREQSLNLE
ncbi:MAG TPA: YicC/YloC family endoribonuclease [Bryobacteraceae bacterium]|nr:YicC/YloC family endoribonuclease [Bryobacteraceae bacterium]